MGVTRPWSGQFLIPGEGSKGAAAYLSSAQSKDRRNGTGGRCTFRKVLGPAADGAHFLLTAQLRCWYNPLAPCHQHLFDQAGLAGLNSGRSPKQRKEINDV